MLKSRIAVLLGGYFQDLDTELRRPAPIPRTPAAVRPGRPVELLRRRPDIRQAERQLAAATARIGVATADLFPRVYLLGGVGVEGGRRQGRYGGAVGRDRSGRSVPAPTGRCSILAGSMR